MSKPLLCALLLLAAAAALQWQGGRLDAKQAQADAQLQELQRQNAAQTAKIERLKGWLDEFKNRREGLLEELVREQLFMIKPGEIYVLPQSEAD